MRTLTTGLLVLVLSGCQKPKNPNLLHFQSFVLREPTEEEVDQNGIDPLITDSTVGDTLFISVLQCSSGFVEYNGDIEYRKDTLVLSYWPTNENWVKMLVIYQMDYKVLNTEKKKFYLALE